MAHCGPLLELSDVQARLGLSAGADAGSQTVAIADIVGTQDRCCDFDRCFHPLRPDLAQRVAAVERAFPGGDYPPIELVQVDRAYFVVDGHKRVAAAHAQGVELIDAHVVRLVTRHSVDAHTTQPDLELAGARERFLSESGLAAARPAADLECRTPAGYFELLEAVKAHGYDLVRAEGRPLGDGEAAAHWHDCDLVPTLSAAEATGLRTRLTSLPNGDLYLAVHRQARQLAGSSCAALERSAHAAAEDAVAQAPRHRLRLRRR